MADEESVRSKTSRASGRSKKKDGLSSSRHKKNSRNELSSSRHSKRREDHSPKRKAKKSDSHGSNPDLRSRSSSGSNPDLRNLESSSSGGRMARADLLTRSQSVRAGRGFGAEGAGRGGLMNRAQSVRLDRNAFAGGPAPTSSDSVARPGLEGANTFEPASRRLSNDNDDDLGSARRSKSKRNLTSLSDDEGGMVSGRRSKSKRNMMTSLSDDEGNLGGTRSSMSSRRLLSSSDDEDLGGGRSRSSRRLLSSDDDDSDVMSGMRRRKSSRRLLSASDDEGDLGGRSRSSRRLASFDADGNPRKKTKRRENREMGTRRRASTRDLMGVNSARNDMSGKLTKTGGPKPILPEDVKVTNQGNFGLRLDKTLLFAPPGSEDLYRESTIATARKKKKRKRRCPKMPWQKEEEEEEEPTTNTTQLTGAMTVRGRKAVGLEVLRIAGDVEAIRSLQESTQTGGYIDLSKVRKTPKIFSPKHLLEIERGSAVLISPQSLVKNHQFQDLGDYGAVVVTMKAKDPLASAETTKDEKKKKLINKKNIQELDFENEVGRIERVWLTRLRRNIMSNLDVVNGLRLSREMQKYMPMQSASDAFLIAQIVASLEGKTQEKDASFVLDIAFKSRNISRIISTTAKFSFDFKEHAYQLLKWIRLGDMATRYLLPVSQLPITENLTPLRKYVPWILSTIFSGKPELLGSDEKKVLAQNMSPLIHGLEITNRNRYGTYIGRQKTIEFRSENRFPADDAVRRSFVTRPIQTMVDYGVVFTLRLLAQHWRNMVSADTNHFANDRLDQLDPFETVRFYIPSVCIAISSFRGRVSWDATVLAEFIQKCQYLKPQFTADKCRAIVTEMKQKIVPNLCSGIESIADPLNRWLDAIAASCTLIEDEARRVYQKITTVEVGLRFGYDLVTNVNFEIPSDEELLMALLLHLRGKNPGKQVRERTLRDAIALMTPRDQRTVVELVKKNQIDSKPAKFLLDRAKALVKRVLRREYFSEAIRHLSMGEDTEDIFHDEWYWVFEGEKKGVYIFDEDSSTRDADCFIHADSGVRRFFDLDDDTVKFKTYIPIAEPIARAQRCYMNIELEHGKRFSYNAFMEFSFLRVALRQLAVVSQIFCEELDDARMTVLREVQLENQEAITVREMKLGTTYYVYNEMTRSFDPYPYEHLIRPGDPQWSRLTERKILKTAPQNIVLVGSGPAGFLTAIHCTESVVASGGLIRLYMESKSGRDVEFFESGEVLRLDQRWIAMLRYHLGTVFEDAFVPTSETNPLLGNNE